MRLLVALPGLSLVGLLLCSCGGGNAASRPDCPAGQTSLDGTCVSQPVADYVSCIRAMGATVASDSAKSLSAAAGVAGVTGSTQADVKDKLEKSYATVSDANALEIIHNCFSKTSAGASTPSPAATVGAPVTSHSDEPGDYVSFAGHDWSGPNMTALTGLGPKDCAERCTHEPQCIGFVVGTGSASGECYLKAQLVEEGPSTNKSTFLRGSNNRLAAYSSYLQQDSDAPSIAQLPGKEALDCARACDEDKTCVSFVVGTASDTGGNAGACWMKGTLGKVVTWERGPTPRNTYCRRDRTTCPQ